MRILLAVSDAARLLGLAPDSVRQLERTGVLPAAGKTPGGMRLFDRSVVERLVREREARQRAMQAVGKAATAARHLHDAPEERPR